MKIIKDIEIVDLGLWIKKFKILILADFHLGFEESLKNAGILIPEFQLKETLERLERIFEKIKTKPEILIINGDLKHDFGKISKQEWREVLKLIKYLEEKAKKIVFIKGNHDTFLKRLTKRNNILLQDFILVEGIAILHGHKIFPEVLDKAIKTLIIAHEHPAVILKDGIKQEKYKCFLLGEYNGKKIIVMPSFITFSEGYDLKNPKRLSPFLKGLNLNNFEVFIISDKVYKFGKFKNL